MAAARSARSATRDTPTDEPRLAGFTNTGYDRPAASTRSSMSSSSVSRTPSQPAWGSPLAARTSLALRLSMHSAEASTPEPTKGIAGQLEHPLHRAVLPTGAVEQREDDDGERRRGERG